MFNNKSQIYFWKFWNCVTIIVIHFDLRVIPKILKVLIKVHFAFFCGFVVWQESLIWKKNSNQISYFLCFVNPLLKKSKSAKIESISSKDKHYRPSHKYGSILDICNARRYYQNTTNKIDLRFMFLATKGFQTSQWLFYLSLIVYVIKQRKDIDWNLWAWDWNSM